VGTPRTFAYCLTVTALPEPAHLRAVSEPAGQPLDGDGLALAYAALERVRREHRLVRLSVVIDDPVLGRQVLVAPRGELPPTLDESSGWSAEPPIDEPSTDLELAVALCRTTLRVEVPASPIDTAELALRRLDGVEIVAVDADVIRIQVGPLAPDQVARQAIGVVKAHLDRTVVVEVTRAHPAGIRASAEPSSVSSPVLELVAVRTLPESGELEVHLRAGEARTIGRASLTRGLVGAAEATLAAWHSLSGDPVRRLAWARTIETSADARFIVAAAIEVAATLDTAYGIGTGRNPMEAAVRATTDALSP
jgi:hypothetical protein